MRLKKLGQHWLFDETILKKVVSAGQVSDQDVVLEIGPGLGTLTSVLIQKAKKVVAVEKDPVLADKLASTVLAKNLEVINQDILEFNLLKLPPKYKVVANIPYYITSNLLRRLLEDANPPQLMVLMVQKEVAERIVADPPQMNLLAFSVQYYAKAKIIDYVNKENFVPPPKVDSAIIKIERRPKPAFSAEAKKLFRLVKAGFAARRKMLKNNLAPAFNSQSDYSSILKSAGVSETARAQDLTINAWKRLYQAIYQN